MAESFGEQLVVTGDRNALENVFLGVEQGRARRSSLPLPRPLAALRAFSLSRVMVWASSGLSRTFWRCFYLGRGDFHQLVGAGFADQNRDFVVRRAAAILRHELFDCLVALAAALAVFFEEIIGDAADLESGIAALCVAPVFDVVAQLAYFARERIAVDLGEVGATFVDVGGLERLPAAFGTVPSQVGGNGVGVELGIEFAAGVVVVNGEHQVAGGAVVVGAILPDAGGGIGFQFLKGFADGLLVSFDQPIIAAQLGHDGNGFGSGDGEVVEIAAVALGGSIGGHAVGALALPQEFAGLRIEALRERPRIASTSRHLRGRAAPRHGLATGR